MRRRFAEEIASGQEKRPARANRKIIGSKEEKTMAKTIHIEGMSCGHCAAHVERALRGIGLDATVDLAKKTAAVAGGDASEEAIRAAIDEAGYEVTKVD